MGFVLAGIGYFTANIVIQLIADSIVAEPVIIHDARLDVAPEILIEVNTTTVIFPVEAPVSTPDFITTLGSPCQVVPTPAPVPKSTQIAAAMATPMPTERPEPTPSVLPDMQPEPEPEPEPVPEPEAVVIPDDGLRAFKLMLDLHISQGKSFLAWYHNLPAEAHHAAIAVSAVLAWSLLTLLAAMASGSVGLAASYFISSALYQLLRAHGLTRNQSLLTSMAVGLVLTLSIKAGLLLLIKLGRMARNNATGLSDLRSEVKSDFGNLQNDFGNIQNDFGNLKSDTEVSITHLDYWVNLLFVLLHRITNNLDSRVRPLESWMGNIQNDFGILRIDFGTLQNGFGILQNRFGILQNGFGNLQNDFGNLQNDFETLKSDTEVSITNQNDWLNALSDWLYGITENLKQRINDVIQESMKPLNPLGKRFRPLESWMGNARTKIRELEKKLDDLLSTVSKLAESLSQLTTRVDELDKDTKAGLKDVREACTENHRKSESQFKSTTETIGLVNREFITCNERISELEQKHDPAVSNTKTDSREDLQATKEDLSKVQDDVASVANDAKQLRSDATKQHDAAMQANSALGTSVDQRFQDSTQAMSDLREETTARDNELSAQHTQLESKVTRQLEQLPTLVEQAIEGRFQVMMQPFFTSKQSLAIMSAAFLLCTQNLSGTQVSDEARTAIQDMIHSEAFLDQLLAMLQGRQANDNNPPGDPPGVIPGRQASSHDTDLSNSHPAPNNTPGHEDPPADPSEGQHTHTLPGDLSSDSTPATSTNPGAPTVGDDAEGHPDTSGVPPVAPPGASTGGRSPSDTPASDGGTTPLPSGDDAAGTPPRGEWKGKGPMPHGGSKLGGEGESAQPRGLGASRHNDDADAEPRGLGASRHNDDVAQPHGLNASRHNDDSGAQPRGLGASRHNDDVDVNVSDSHHDLLGDLGEGRILGDYFGHMFARPDFPDPRPTRRPQKKKKNN